MAHRLEQYFLILKNPNNCKLLSNLESLNKITFSMFLVTNKIGNSSLKNPRLVLGWIQDLSMVGLFSE